MAAISTLYIAMLADRTGPDPGTGSDLSLVVTRAGPG
jgi:hypothetical protein